MAGHGGGDVFSLPVIPASPGEPGSRRLDQGLPAVAMEETQGWAACSVPVGAAAAKQGLRKGACKGGAGGGAGKVDVAVVG